MALGDLLAPIGSKRLPLVSARRMAPRDAAAAALAAYMRAWVFTIPPKGAGADVKFKLTQVLEEWPNEDNNLNQPSAAITTITEERMAHNFVPTILESTWNKYAPNSILWKTDEIEILFQLDFWITNKAERQAVEASLSEYFCPEEGRWGVMLEGPSAYWSQPIRFTLSEPDGNRREDDSDMVQSRDRKLLVRVRATIDDLQLRYARPLDVHVTLAVGDAPAEEIFPREAGA